MTKIEWVRECSARLQEQWVHVEPADLDEMACKLWDDELYNWMEPREAALAWLRICHPKAA